MAAGSLAAAIVLGGALIANAAGAISYTIRSGDTLSEIAESNGTHVSTLAELNGLENPDLIVTGDELLIPSDGAGDPELYTVQDGDTLSEIALKFGISVEELAALNGIENVDLIITGDELHMPVVAADEAPVADDDTAAEGAVAGADATATPEAEEGAAEATDDAADATDDAEATETEAADEADEAEPTEEAVSDDATEDEASEGDGATAGAVVEVSSGDVRLHLVTSGETLGDIAAQYDVTADQIVAANALVEWDIPAGTILKIPPAGTRGIQLTGMPSAVEEWPVASELAATALATSYWGSTVPAQTLLDAIAPSDNPHAGFRGDYQGMWGTTDDYGVYAGPLADVLQANGFGAEAFYADGDPSALTDRISAGVPVVAWVTYGLSAEEPEYVETEAGGYTLVPNQHAVVVFGFDEEGVFVVDVSDGSYLHYGWDEFMASWSYFDGMGLAVYR